MLERRELLKIGAALGGCAALPHSIASALAASRVPAFSWKLQPAEAAGMTREGLAGARAAIQKNIDAKVIAGAVTAVARHNKLVLFEAQGWSDVEARKPMRTDSLFRMMSSTKVVTAVAVMMMVEEGKFALEDPVSKFIPSFHNQRVMQGNTTVPANRDITIKDLLTHTSGLSGGEQGVAAGAASLSNKADRGPGATLASVVPQLGSNALDFQPGTKFRYSPLDGMDTLLYLVELRSGMPAEHFVKKRILQPLEMRSTYFHVPPSQADRIVKLYESKGGQFRTRPGILDNMPETYTSGAGGLISCAHDMLNFELMLLNGGTFNGRRLLKPETVALMATNHVGTLFSDWIPFMTGGNGFGLSVRILEDEKKGGGRSVGAFGWGGAYGTETWADPKLDMACVMLIQMDPAAPNVKIDFTEALRRSIVA